MDETEYYTLDKNKDPRKVTLEYWGKLFGNIENRLLKKTYKVGVKNIRISSVFLGIPLEGGMFETMVTELDNDDKIYRYETYEECIKEHNKLIKKLGVKYDTARNE